MQSNSSSEFVELRVLMEEIEPNQFDSVHWYLAQIAALLETMITHKWVFTESKLIQFKKEVKEVVQPGPPPDLQERIKKSLSYWTAVANQKPKPPGGLMRHLPRKDM